MTSGLRSVNPLSNEDVCMMVMMMIIYQLNVVAGETSLMETEDTQSRKYNRRTLRDEHGQYPAWMNQRAMRKQKNKSVTLRCKAKVKRSVGRKSKKWLDLYSGLCYHRKARNVMLVKTKTMLHLADVFARRHTTGGCISPRVGQSNFGGQLLNFWSEKWKK